MKGSPMQRNFGIGSPLRANDEGKVQPKIRHTPDYDKMDPSKRTKRKLYETPSGKKYYKNPDGSKTYIDTEKPTVDPYEGEKKIYTTEGKPSKKKKRTTKKKTTDAPQGTVEKVKKYIKTKKKDIEETIKRYL